MLETKFLEIVVPDGSNEDLNSKLQQYVMFGWEPNVSNKQRVKTANAVSIGSVNLSDAEFGDEYTVTLKRDTKMENYQYLSDLERENNGLLQELIDLDSVYYEVPKQKGVSSGIPMWAKVVVSIIFFPFGLLIFLIKDKTPEQMQMDNDQAFANEERRLEIVGDVNQQRFEDEERRLSIEARLNEIAQECRSL